MLSVVQDEKINCKINSYTEICKDIIKGVVNNKALNQKQILEEEILTYINDDMIIDKVFKLPWTDLFVKASVKENEKYKAFFKTKETKFYDTLINIMFKVFTIIKKPSKEEYLSFKKFDTINPEEYSILYNPFRLYRNYFKALENSWNEKATYVFDEAKKMYELYIEDFPILEKKDVSKLSELKSIYSKTVLLINQSSFTTILDVIKDHKQLKLSRDEIYSILEYTTKYSFMFL